MPRSKEEWVPLAQADVEREWIGAQLETVLHSDAFAKAGNAKKMLAFLVDCSLDGIFPTPEQIALAGLEQDDYNPSGSLVRNVAKDTREKLQAYYASEAKPEELRLRFPNGAYVIQTLRSKGGGAAASTAHRLSGLMRAKILSPTHREEVYSSPLVRGRIDALNPDLRVWLVVLATDFFYYPQCLVSRQKPEWEYPVRIGRMNWGETDGVLFKILLIAADVDADFAFHTYKKANGDGFGTLLPKDTWELDSVEVVRRDIRPGQPNDPTRV